MDKLKKNKDFRYVYKKGKSFATRYLVLYIKKNSLNENRVGYSISKKVGKATVRNKIKRRLKEIIRKIDKYKKGYDIIFIARNPIVNLHYQDLKKEVYKLLKKVKIINNEMKGD